MVTTIGPWKRPAGRQARLETNIGTSVPHSTFRLNQRMLESQAAAKQKGDKVVAPQVANIFRLADKLAITVDAVAGQIGAQVGARGRADGLRVAGRRNLDQRAGLGVAGTKGGEFGGRLLWQNHQIGLLVARALSSSAATPFAAAGRRPHLGRRGDRSRCRVGSSHVASLITSGRSAIS